MPSEEFLWSTELQNEKVEREREHKLKAVSVTKIKSPGEDDL
jgi:hypothetical protein